MKTKLYWIALVAVVGSVVGSATEEAGKWGGKEIQAATQAAVETFRLSAKPDDFATVSGLSVERNNKGNAASVEIRYDGGSASFFCHAHGADIDCH